jgi:cell division protein FtsI (penicillin-binding protein 3)
VFHDAEVHGTLHLTLTGILQRSSNIGAIQVAKRLGPKRLYQYFRAFGLGSPTGVQLPGDGAGLVPPLSSWSATTLPTVSFGQGISVSALQIASVYSTIANGGVRVAPTVLQGTVGANGKVQAAAAPARRRVISAHTALEMREMLQSVTTTQEGTAPDARIDGYTVAGKTGTANVPNGRGGYSGFTSSFVGMVPARHPKLVAEVVLDKPKTDHFGGAVAAPVFHTVMSFALQALGIRPTGNHKPTIPTTW